MLPDKLSGKKPVVPDNFLFVPDLVRDRPLIFRLALNMDLSFPQRLRVEFLVLPDSKVGVKCI
jgi:hypothetical protein